MDLLLTFGPHNLIEKRFTREAIVSDIVNYHIILISG